MFALALFIGIYSYIIFAFGLLGFLYKDTVVVLTLFYFFIIIFSLRTRIKNYNLWAKIISFVQKSTKLELFILLLLLAQAMVNLIGVLGPELGFDALWYHLTIPKIYLINQAINYIPGGLFYYSAMPKLTEMLYVAGLAFGSEILAKFIHFSFGVLCLIALYEFSRKFLPKTFSLLVPVLFYSNLVVGWMSITAYVDLARTFFEIMALWGFLNWIEKKENKWLILSAVLLGLAISTKLLALGSLLIFSILIIIFTRKITDVLVYCFFALLVSMPWFVFSFINTGNPVYPFFSDIYPIKPNLSLINPLSLSDPISPLYVILVPIGFIFFSKLESRLKLISLYSLLAFFVWQLTPNTGGGRFILPYLPAISILSISAIVIMKKRLQAVFIVIIIFYSLLSIAYRGVANFKYIPVIFGNESKAQFLSNHLNFSFGDFYDTDNYFRDNMKKGDVVLLYGFHNLYYVNFPFIDSSYVKKGDLFNYIAVQGNNLPKRFNFWNLIYYNDKTNVKLYSVGDSKWTY